MKLFNKSTSVLIALCTTSSLLISGCSSSDKNPSSNAVSNTNHPQDMQASETAITGNVVKGLVKNADVFLYNIINNQIDGRPFASAKTDENGSFEVSVASDSVSDALYIEVLAAADGSSSMTCDAESCGETTDTEGEDTNGNGVFDFGESIKLSEDFRLSAALTSFKNSEHINVSVTPISHLAMQRAKRKGKLDPASINEEMSRFAALLNLPAELSQLIALDITNLIDNDLDKDSVRYSLYNAAIAEYARKHHLTIARALEKIDAELYDANGDINRELLVDLLRYAHKGAARIAKGNGSLQQLIAEMMVVINRYQCSGRDSECGPIKPPAPPQPPVQELVKVKEFVRDFRSWVRDLTMQNNPALANFAARTEMVGHVWEDDIKILAAALNDVLPGVAQAVSPAYSFCYYCDYEGTAFAAANTEKEMTVDDLHYVLTSDGALSITGMVRDVGVDMRLQFPAPDVWATQHSVEITAGRLSRDNMDLVISKGSRISAVFPEGVRFGEVISGVRNDVAPIASEVSAQLNFFVEAEYGISAGGTIDFESGIPVDWLQSADWSTVQGKSNSGLASLRSPAVGDNDNARFSATINTLGGYLGFNYSVESEAGYDFFNVYVDGSRVMSASGFQPEFKNAQIFLAPGEHTIIWEYAKDASVAHNQDGVWIDDIQYPALADSDDQELVSHNILSGDMTVTAYKLDQPWQFTSQSYLPGDVRVNAVFSNQFLAANSIEEDEITLNIAATIANAAEFEPPQPYDEGTLALLGNYTVSEDLFTFNLQNWSIHITPVEAGLYRYEVFRGGDDSPLQSYLASSDKKTMKDVAGELIDNSGIGLQIVVPQEGLYLTTLLKSSPWGTYNDSRFSASGGNIYGYLVEPFDPTETDDQFLKVAAAFEMQLRPYDLPEMIFGSHLTRDTLTEGSFEFYIIVDGKRFNFTTQYWYNMLQFDNDDASVDLKAPQLTIENHNGVVLDLKMPDKENLGSGKDEPALEGELSYNNVVYGKIKRVKGLTAIEYVDGTGESIE